MVRRPPVASDVEPKPNIPGQNVAGMHIYIRSGLKSHGEGQHDYPQFLADWSKILTDHGAVVDGSFHSPTAAELEGVDVVVMYKGDAGYMTRTEKAALDAFVKRGGGLVTLHDSLCGPNPPEFAGYVGGAKRHGERNFSAGPITYSVKDAASPIMKGVPNNLTIQDEAFYNMTMAPSGVHVLATFRIPDNEGNRAAGGANLEVPQMWTYEHTVPGGQPARAFVWMQGHTYANLTHAQLEPMLLRGIAWAGKKPVDLLADYKPPVQAPRGQGAPGGQRPAGAPAT
jgi:type 1 glutamine amidotransferase